MIIKFIKKKFNSIKICAVFTTVCFVVSTLGANLYAIPLAENASQKYEDVFNKASSISAEYGKITASKDAKSDITVINIQDLHCHPQTQRNISQIIKQIADKYNLKKIYVEGGYGNIDTGWLDSIKDEQLKAQIIEKLMEEGILTGSEYYKLINNNEVELKGIDEEEIHKDNVRRLSWIIENQDKYKDTIAKVENEINILEKMYVNSRNERFNRDIEKYLTSEIDSRRFYRQLVKYVRDINENPDKYNNITAIRLEDYPNIMKFIALRKTSKDIDVREVTQQLQMVINELKNRIPYNVYTRLLSETENFSDSQKVVELITMLCAKEGINLENKYEALKNFLESNDINRQLNTVELVLEERQLLSEIRKALSYNNEEYEITFLSDFSRYFKDYLEYKLTDADWKYFESSYDQFRTLYSKYAVVDRIQEIDDDFDELNKYYRINDQRNNIFVANLLKDEEVSILETDRVRQDEEILKDSKEVIIAVTGGFHSSELEDILAKKEVNTIVITPSIFEGIEKATKQYKGIIKDQSRFFQHQALAYTLASCVPNAYQRNLLYSAAKEILGGDVEKLKDILGEDVDLTVFDNLQPLTEQEQLKVNRIIGYMDFLPKKGFLSVFYPSVDDIILGLSEKLVKEGIFFSRGPVIDAERAGLPDLKGISPEVYSRMHAIIQEALLATEVSPIEERKIEEDIDEEVFEKSETVIEDEEADLSYFSEDEKAELLEKVRDKNKPFSVDQDLVFSVFEKMIVPFIEDNDVDNIDEYYELFLRKLFSLQPEVLNFLNDKMDGQSIKDLLVDYEAEVIDKNLTDLLARYNEKLSSLKDFSRIVLLFENIEKLNSLSEQDFDYFMGLPKQFFIYVWAKTENSSQLKTKIAVGKKFYPKKRFKTFDRTLAKAYFANAEKLESLDESSYKRFINLNKEAQLFILDNVKNSSDIERIFEFSDKLFSDKNKISSDFDNSKDVKDFKDVRFKALVKYISSVDDMSFYDKLFSTDYYGQKDIFGDYDKRSQKALKIIVDSIDDANFIKEYLLNPKYKGKYSTFFRRLVKLKIKNVAVENDYLALKLLTDENFNKALDDSKIHTGVPTSDRLVARYHAAIAVSRFIYDGAEGEIKDYDLSENKELIKEVTDLYILLLTAADGNVLMDSKTKIYALCNDEKNNDRFKTDRFNTDSIERMAKLAGVEVPIITFLRKNNLGAKDEWLQQIEDLVLASDGKAYFFFNGHGEKDRLCVKNGEEYISAEELADRLFKLATKPGNPVDLRRVTIDLSCCHSYFFARDVYKLLEAKFKDNPDKESYPTIITAAGLETEVGYTRIGAGAVTLSNLHDGILKVLNKRGETAPLTLGMLALSEYQFDLSNITMFTSFSDETLLERIAETKKHISAAFKDSKGKAIEVESKTSDSRVKLKTKVPNLPIFGFEASVERGDKFASIWEEFFYRFVPSMVFLGVIFASTMLFPAVPAIGVIAKLVYIGVFSFIQTKFIKAHIVTDWLEAMDAGGPILKDIFERVKNRDLSLKDGLNIAIERIKKRLLVILPDSTEEKSFYRFYTINKQAVTHREGLIIPTIIFSVPYAVAILFFGSMPAVAIATVLSMAIHYVNNQVARSIEEKQKLKEMQLSGEFLDIRKRIRHVELLVENPQMKMDLPKIVVGPIALKFGLEKKEERKDKSLAEFEELIDKLTKSITDELSKIEKKKRKSKKDKERIAELQKELELIEKEYPTVITENGEKKLDTTKIEGVVNSIDNLLAIFEEIENILNAIDFLRYNGGNAEEIKELEKEFLDFVEQTLMKELMSLYDTKVTGVHVRRVVGFAKFIGKNMSFGNNVRVIYKLMLSSVLHDIGKNLIPESILNKQGTFNDFEKNIMEFHVVFGGFILRSSILKNLSYTAENHHYTKNSQRSYSFNTKMNYPMETSDYDEADEDARYEALIAKIVTLADVFEAVSPKLSFSTERTYQFPKKIRDISDMLENIEDDIDLTESQKKEVIILLAEIAQIDSEEDAEQKELMEQKFIKKVLYNRSKSDVINYVRKKNNESVRANAFKVIFTEYPKDVFSKLGKTEEEFMTDFREDRKGTVEKCMELVDKSKLEFDTEVVKAFLEFYFSNEDVNINNAIIESLNKAKENAFIVYIKDVSYSLWKMFRKVRFFMFRFAPIIASISRGSGKQSVKDYFNIDTDIIDHNVLITKKDGEVYILHFDAKLFRQTGRRSAGVTMLPKNYGIEEIEYDENGKITNLILEEGTSIEPILTEEEKLKKGQKKLVGNKENNLAFEEVVLDSIKKNIRETTGKDVSETVDIYLDSETVISDMENAIKENKLMVIHVFKEGFRTEDLSTEQLYEKYNQILKLINGGFASIFSENTEEEEQILKQIREGLTAEEKDDFEWTKRETAKALFSLREILKNDFDHGNKGLIEYPIALYISKNEGGKVSDIITYNFGTKATGIDSAKEKTLSNLIYESYISGSKKGAEYIESSLFVNFEHGFIPVDGIDSKYKIHRTRAALKDKKAQEQAIAEYNQYIQENRQKKLEEQQRLERMSEKEKEAELKRKADADHAAKMASFWDDFISILKPFGWKLEDDPHVWEEALFRYLPTALIVSGSMGYLFGLGLQVVFILAHPIAKWIAEKQNGKKVGIGDLFQKIGKTYLGLPTLTMMLPYVGALLAFAINPALSILMTPALFMFAEVIVQWLTKKDSGGMLEININKKLVIVLAIASIAGYAILPFIPVMHPLVNALINPIVVTNFFSAGRLHYEYNKRQQDDGRLLSIKGKNKQKEEEPVIKKDVREMIQRLADKYNIDLSTNKVLTDLLFKTRTPSQTLLCYMGQTNLDALFKILSQILPKISVTDPNYDVKCQIIVRSCIFVGFNFDLKEKGEEIEWVVNQENRALLIFAQHTPLLITDHDTFEYFGLYTDDQLNSLNRISDNELEELLELNPTENANVFMAVLDMSNITKHLDSETFKDLIKLYLMHGVLPLEEAMKRLGVITKDDEEKAKELGNYIKLIKENSDVIVNISKDFLNNIIGKTNSADEFREYMDVINKNSDVIVNILNIDEKIRTEIITKINSADELKKYFSLIERYKFTFDTTTKEITEQGVKNTKEVPVDYRWKIALEYLNIEEDIEGEIFKYLLTRKDPNGYKYELFENFPKDSAFFREMFYETPENKDKYIKLFDSLVGFQFKGIASENDFLALRLLVDTEFVSALEGPILNKNKNMSDAEKIVATYHAAIAVSRFIYDTIEGEIKDYNRSRIRDLIKEVTELYLLLLSATGGNVIMNQETQIYALCNDEQYEYEKGKFTDRFNTDAIEEMARIVGVKSPIQKYLRKNDSYASAHLLSAIEGLQLKTKDARGYFVLNVHGAKDYVVVRNKGENVEEDRLYAKDLAKSLFKLATRPEDPVDLRRVTLDLSCCNSYFFAKNVYDLLEGMLAEYAKTHEGFKETYPTIITAAGLETELGFTIYEGKNATINLHKGILGALKKNEPLTLDMLALSEYKFASSNITMFTSFNKDLSGKIVELRQKIITAFEEDKKQQGVVSVRENVEERERGKDAQVLPGVVGVRENAEDKEKGVDDQVQSQEKEQIVELSIVPGLRKYAPVWEEIVFRYIPTALIILNFANPMLGIAMGVLSQVFFILAHPIAKWITAKKNNEQVNIKELIKEDVKNLSIPTLVMMLPYAGSILALAVAPALEIIISPALFMFADVIVQWLTNKDSGGKISISKGLVISTVISSLLAFSITAAFPVISPFINPIVITNTIRAGILHYEYNQRQQDRDKSLNLVGDSEKAKEVVKDGQESDAKSKSEHVKIVADSIDLEGNYEIEGKIKHFRFRKRDLVKFSDESSLMENEDSFISITLPKGYELSNYGVNKSLSTKDGKIRIKKEKSFKRFIVITDDSKKEHIFFINEEGYREITISLEGTEDVSLKELKDKTGVDIGKDEIVPPKNEVLLKIHDLTVESCSEPFTIELSKEQKNNFIFIRGNFYKISEQGKKEIILKEELEKYGIDLEHSVIENGKIVSLYLILGAKIGVSVRQAVGIDEEEMAYRMEQILGSRDVDSRQLITLDEYEEVPTDFVIYFFQVQGLAENVINDIINNINSEGVGATIYPKTLEDILITNGFLEEDAKMWVERIFTEYIGDFSNMDISEEIPLDFLRYFLQKEENKNIHGQQDIIKLLSDRGKQISIEDLEQDLLVFGFSKEESVEIINEIKEKNLKIANNFLRKILEQLGLNEEDIEMLNGKGRNLTIKDLEDAFAEQGFDEIKIGEYIEKIKKSFEENMIPGYVSSFLVDKFRELGLNKKAANGRAANIIAKCGDKNSLILLTKLKEELVNDGVSEKEADLWVKQIYENYRASEAKKEKSSGIDGLQISFLKPFIEKKVPERKIVEFFFERTRFISIENLERELIGLGYSKQEAEILIERIRNEYPQQTERFQKIPTDYVISLFKKGFIDKKIVLFLEAGKTTSKEDLEKGFMRYGYSEQESKEIVEEILDQYSKDIRKRNVQVISKYQRERILMRADVSGTDQVISLRIENEQLESMRKVLSNINELDENQLISLLERNPMLLSMLIEALNRGFVFDKKEIETFGELVEYLQKRKENNEKGDNENVVTLRGYFGEIYLAETTVSGELDGLKLILQLPKNVNEPGIDLIDPITGMKIQVKIDEGDSTAEAFSKNPTVPIACTNRVAKNKNQPTIRGFVEMETMMDFATSFLGLIYKIGINIIKEEGKNPSYQIVVGGEIKDNVNLTNTSAIIKILNSLSDANAILPENMGLVNKIMQSRFGNAFIAATVIAFREFRASLEPDFVNLHQTAAGRRGAQQVASLANRYNITEQDSITTKIVKSILGIIFRGASIVKHIAIDYRYIKASGLQEAINMFGKNAKLTEEGQIEIAIVEDIDQLKDGFTLVNTGLKVNGASIYRIKNSDLLIYGARGQQSIKIVQTINGTEQLKQSVIEMLKASGEQIDDIETQGIVIKQGEGIEVKEGIIEIGEMELEGKTIQQIKDFITSSLEINRAIGIMYGQKTIIGLEYMGVSDVDKLKSAIENGRARKVITTEQYKELRDKIDNFREYLLELRKNGIEVYIDTIEKTIDEKEIEEGIAGQVVMEKGELCIQDYYSLEQTKLLKVDSEMLKERSLEQIILSESETIFVGIEVLIEQFRKSNINLVQREFGALLGKIKLTLNIGELNFKDIENILYNIDYNKIPKLDLPESKKLQEYKEKEINSMLESIIQSLDETSELSIILKAIRKNKNFSEADYDAFVQIIKERILAKTALTQSYKEFGLKDKHLEKLLGQLLFKQLDFNVEDKDSKNSDNFDFTYIDKNGQRKEVSGEKERNNDNKEEYIFMRKIIQDTEKARRGDRVAINSIIDIILTYGEDYKEKQLTKKMDENDMRNYRSMLSAA